MFLVRRFMSTTTARTAAPSSRGRLGVERLESRDVPSAVAAGNILQVKPGDATAYQSIQAALNAATPGTEIDIAGGTYREAINVTKSGITLKGSLGSRVVIDNPGSATNGITVQDPVGAPLTGFTLSNVTVQNFVSDGVFLSGVNGFTLSGVTASNNRQYGLAPVLSSNGLIDLAQVSGSNDTGVYVGQSQNVTVQRSTASANTNGFEIENSSNVTVKNNTAVNNSVGIVEDLLPGLAVTSSVGNVISGNQVMNNNRPNSAPAGDLASLEPAGTGIGVVGGTGTQVLNNTVAGNAYAGIAVLSGNDLLPFAPAGSLSYPPSLNPDPTSTLVSGNTLLGNATSTVVPPAGYPAAADLIWTGTGTGNHWTGNHYRTASGLLP